jgi:hypothetical protein
MRAARLPPMKTFDDPMKMVKNGANPPHVGAMPKSAARAAGLPPISTCTYLGNLPEFWNRKRRLE